MRRNRTQSVGAGSYAAALLTLALLSVGSAAAQQDEAEFWFPSDPGYALVEVLWIGSSVDSASVRIFSDGRVEVFRPTSTLRTSYGTYEMWLGYHELRDLIRMFNELGVMDFDADAVKQKLAERAFEPGVRRNIVTDAGITLLTLMLPRYRPVGAQTVIRDYERSIRWEAPRNDAEWSGLAEMEGLTEALGMLRDLYSHPNLSPVPDGGGTGPADGG